MSNAAKIKYKKKAIKTFYLDLNTNTDADIICWLEKKTNKSGAIKRLIRAYGVPIDEESTPVELDATSTPVDTDTKPDEESTPVELDATSTPVDTDTKPDKESTPVELDATSTPVESRKRNLAEIMGITELMGTEYDETSILYEVVYLTKKGGNRYRAMNVFAHSAKEAVANFKKMYPRTDGHAFHIKARRPYTPEKAGSEYPETSDILAMYRKIPGDYLLTNDYTLNEMRKKVIQKAAEKGKKAAFVRSGNRIWKYSTESGELIEAGYSPMN